MSEEWHPERPRHLTARWSDARTNASINVVSPDGLRVIVQLDFDGNLHMEAYDYNGRKVVLRDLNADGSRGKNPEWMVIAEWAPPK